MAILIKVWKILCPKKVFLQFETFLPPILRNQEYTDIPFILFHRFNGVISDWLGMEKVYFSYSPVKSMKRIMETPQNRLLLETDSENVADIVQWTNRVADECKISKNVFVNNAKRMFGNG